MHLRAVALSVISFLCLYLPSACTAQEVVTVRVVDARSGKPQKGHQVWLQFYPLGETKIQRIEQESGADGIARVQLSDPLPQNVQASVDFGSDHYIGSWIDVHTRELMTAGAVARDTGRPALSSAASQLSPKPGEIILFVCPHSLWWRLIAPLERG